MKAAIALGPSPPLLHSSTDIALDAVVGFLVSDDIISEQQLVNCDSSNGGCNGGWPSNAMQYLIKSGSMLASTYPYRAVKGTCTYGSRLTVIKGGCYTKVPKDVMQIKRALFMYGPLAPSVYVKPQSLFTRYKFGVYYEADCPTDGVTINHHVNIVGHNTMGGVDYWIVRNSWGTTWGDGGYILMRMGVHLCNIEAFVYGFYGQ